jgi:choline dehydrogenase-like flavoprotein
LIDSGQALEPDKVVQIEGLAKSGFVNWTGETTQFLREGMASSSSGIPLKLAYGSDFPYREPIGATPVACEGADTRPSYALGGLSTVWGSAVLPYRQEDLDEWPVTVQDLEEGYRAVLKWMPLAGRRDDLDSVFPLYSQNYSPLPLSRQAAGLLSDLESRKSQLNRQGVLFGTSRLAVNSAPTDGPGCVSCGLCMYGCPYHLIYSSDRTLKALLSHPRFRYRSGLTVRTVEEDAHRVALAAVDGRGETVRLEGDRVFLAAGVLGSASILLRSTGQYNQPITLKDSQYYLLPLLRLKGTANVATEHLHTLSQLFLEIFDPAVSPYTVHLQTYTYNELFRDPVAAKLGPARPFFPLESFVGRLILFQGYLHSVHSPHIQLTLRKTDNGDKLTAVGVPNPETGKTLRKLVKKLTGLARMTGLLPLFPMLQPGKPGRGFHSGGTFPMRSNPRPGESDMFGRPSGMKRVHAVDASVFPTVPATTITFTVMANAYRIGSLLEQYA